MERTLLPRAWMRMRRDHIQMIIIQYTVWRVMYKGWWDVLDSITNRTTTMDEVR